jgi:hypothetical protein
MELWVAVLLFFSGAAAHMLFSKVLNITYNYKFTQALTDQILTLVLFVVEDVAFIKKIKYESMKDSGVSEDEVDLIKKIDERSFLSWKQSLFTKIFSFYPKGYETILKNYDWKRLTKELDSLYDNS